MNGEVPVKEGDVITEKCIGIGEKGDGVFKKDNFVVIVPNTEKDKTYEIKINKVLRRVAFGEVIQNIEE